ncbi:MAG TPA: energy transducer TonB [Patescibacteria group bacterium]|nr:energy transducer TonB [Patescibacteria group bacterium]
MIRRPTSQALLILAALCALAPNANPVSKPPIKTVSVTLSPRIWTTIPLPFQALWVGANNGNLWACGWDEGVAESSDGGKTWQVLHLHKNGRIFFSLTFQGSQIFASATGGYILSSDDGGQHWKHWLAPLATPMQTALCGGAVIAAAPGILEFRPAGQHAKWSGLNVTVRSNAKNRFHPSFVEAACADRAHWGWIVKGDGKTVPSRFYATADAGKHWKISAFPATWSFTSLVAQGGVYDLYGYKSAKGKSQQGLVLYSSDGVKWQSWPETPHAPLRHCAGAACEMETGMVDLRTSPPQFWQWPKNYPEPMASLASVGKVICATGSQMACALGTSTTEASLESGSKGSNASKAHPRKLVPGRCLKCTSGVYPVGAKIQGCEGDVMYGFLIPPSGKPEDFVLIYAPCKELAVRGRGIIRRWRYAPTLLGGKPIEEWGIGNIIYTLAPGPAN